MRLKVTSALAGAALSALLFSSCKATYYQVYETRPSALNTTMSRVTDVVYEDENVRVMYNMWTENGYPGYAVTNLTDEMLYVDKELSFLRLNGVTKPYYQGKEFTSSGTATIATGTKSILTKALSSLNVLGSSSASGYSFYGYSSASGDSQTTADGSARVSTSVVQSELVSTSGYAETTIESKSLIIPPSHTMTMTIYDPIVSGIYVDCDMDYSPSKRSPSTRTFEEFNSPVTFDNILTYRVGKEGKDQRVNVGFFVSSITNYREKAIVEKEWTNGKECKGLRELRNGFGWTNYYNSQKAPNRFYFIYHK